MTRIVLAAALIASALALARHEHVLDRAGLLGSCSEVPAAVSDSVRWLACRPGSLTGYPDLSQDSCSQGGLRGDVRYWRCPAALVAGRTPDASSTR